MKKTSFLANFQWNQYMEQQILHIFAPGRPASAELLRPRWEGSWCPTLGPRLAGLSTVYIYIYLVGGSTPLKNISQWEWLFPYIMENTHIYIHTSEKQDLDYSTSISISIHVIYVHKWKFDPILYVANIYLVSECRTFIESVDLSQTSIDMDHVRSYVKFDF